MTAPVPGSEVRILLADDHPVVRDGLRALLGSLDGMIVVGDASTGRQAVRGAVTLHPDVLVMDLQMPDLDGITATREIARAAPGVAVLVLTMFEDDDNVYDAMRAGARGYVLKGAPQQEIAQAIRAVAAGGAVFGSAVAGRILDQLTHRSPEGQRAVFPQLTAREREVLNLVAGGLGNAAIAARLGLSPKTVANHLSSIFAKIQVSGRPEAIVQARDAGLGRAGRPPG